jgi:adenine phosphoribosyltransferase
MERLGALELFGRVGDVAGANDAKDTTGAAGVLGRVGGGRYRGCMTVISDASMSDVSWLTMHVRDIADYPRPGVTFRDITPLLGDAEAFRRAVDELAAPFRELSIDRVVGVEARGFIPAAAVAYTLGAGFVPVRKAGKLPWAVAREEYELEYGRDKLEIHRDAIHPDERIVVIDDVLATGGTASATARLVTALGGVIVGLGFLIELADLGGRERLTAFDVAILARM